MTTQPMSPEGPLFDLEATIRNLKLWIPHASPEADAALLSSALHHLEAGKRKMPDGNFTKRTLKILNDIAEDVDCGESKKVLRETIAEMAHEWEAVTQQEHLKRMDRELEVLRKLSDQMDAYSKSKEAQPTTPTEEPQG